MVSTTLLSFKGSVVQTGHSVRLWPGVAHSLHARERSRSQCGGGVARVPAGEGRLGWDYRNRRSVSVIDIYMKEKILRADLLWLCGCAGPPGMLGWRPEPGHGQQAGPTWSRKGPRRAGLWSGQKFVLQGGLSDFGLFGQHYSKLELGVLIDVS